MLDFDAWQEIFETLRRNRLRAILTGFSVAWGIFLLIVLLGSGQGLKNGIEHQFRDDAVNSIWMRPGRTSTPYKGLQPGRDIQFTNEDFNDIQANLEGVEHLTARFNIRGSTTVTYKDKHENLNVRCVHPDHRYLENTQVTAGRFLNEFDLEQRRKVAALGKLAKERLFGSAPAMGEYIAVNGVAFLVVGLFEDSGSDSEMETVYLPISTAQQAFGGANRVRQIMFTTGDADVAETTAMAETLHQRMATRHRFDPKDRRAISVRNINEMFLQVQGVLQGIRLFIWLIGVGTILAGVVGVSNIMIIAVRERTREIGIRKALGATPWSIISMVLLESVLITAVAGYVGLVLGIALLEVLASELPAAALFRNPSVDLAVAIQATLFLVAAGAAAGFVPARRAAAVQPIEALREE